MVENERLIKAQETELVKYQDSVTFLSRSLDEKKLAALEREREGEEAREKAEAEAAATGGRDGGRAYLQQWRGDKSSPAAVQLRILEELYSSASSRGCKRGLDCSGRRLSANICCKCVSKRGR